MVAPGQLASSQPATIACSSLWQPHAEVWDGMSAFVQGEGIEEAVARETREEAGIRVSAVDIVGSQPWPVGEACGYAHL